MLIHSLFSHSTFVRGLRNVFMLLLVIVKKNSKKWSISEIPNCQTVSEFGYRQMVGSMTVDLARLWKSYLHR